MMRRKLKKKDKRVRAHREFQRDVVRACEKIVNEFDKSNPQRYTQQCASAASSAMPNPSTCADSLNYFDNNIFFFFFTAYFFSSFFHLLMKLTS